MMLGACVLVLLGLAGVSGQSATPLSGSCYRDTDCQYYHKDSSGLVTGQVVGTCEKRSESLSMCKCLPAYTGKNCEYKRCPVALETEFMCNGVQGEGEDYYGPVKGLYMGSEWNTYDEVRTVDNHIQSYLSTTGRTVSYKQLHRGPHKVGGICDFTTGKCKCHPTYYGAACDLRTCPMGFGHNQLVKTTCSTQGTCIPERSGQEYVCKCNDNFFGLDCSLRHCPNSTRGYECDNHGSCEYSSGFCKCSAGWYGPSCEFKKCPRVNGRTCNGQGVCFASTWENSIGTMSEGNFTDYEGKKYNNAPVACDHTPGAATQGRLPDASYGSTCRPKTGQKQGVCSCRWPYFGDDCSQKLCPNSTYSGTGTGFECDGHGTCNRQTGACSCQAGFMGKDCHLRACPFSANNQQRKSLECNGEGSCNRQTGLCGCHDRRYWGPACERLRCLSYPDSKTSQGLMSAHSQHYDGPTVNQDGYVRWPNECSGPDQGECDTTRGKCMCKAGFYGDDCAQRGVGDGLYNRRLNFNFNEGRKLRSDGTLRDRTQWHFSGEGTSVPQV